MRQPEPLTIRVLRVLYNASRYGRTLTRAQLYHKARCSPESEVTRALRDLRKKPWNLTIRCATFPGRKYPCYWLPCGDENLTRAAELLAAIDLKNWKAKKGVAA